MIRQKTIAGPSQTIGMTVTLADDPKCAPSPTGLYWFSDLTGAYDQASEAAYVLPDGVAGPVLGVAKVLGETCGDVIWRTTWTPENGGGKPVVVEDDDTLIVYPLIKTGPGILTVSARSNGREFGPILLTVLQYQCSSYSGYSYNSTCGNFDPLTWSTGETDKTVYSVGDGLTLPLSAFPVLSSVTGSWPIGTSFAWETSWTAEAPPLLSVGSSINALAVSPTGELFGALEDAYTLTVSVTATAPGCDPVVLGPITLNTVSVPA